MVKKRYDISEVEYESVTKRIIGHCKICGRHIHAITLKQLDWLMETHQRSKKCKKENKNGN